MTKKTYSYAKIVRKTVFANGNEKLTVTLTEGKSGFNVKASLKLQGDDAPKALTGKRSTLQDMEQAVEAFEALVQEATDNGWTVASASNRDAFSSIPKPGEFKPGSLTPAKSSKKAKK